MRVRTRNLWTGAGVFCVLLCIHGPFAAVAQTPAAPVEAPQDPIVGTWITEPEAEVTILPCDEGLCGYITKVVVPDEIKQKYGDRLDQFNGNYVDRLNENPALRDRPIQGLQILSLTDQVSPERWDGTIYNPEDGKTYEGFLELAGPDRLVISGCVMFRRVCQEGQQWTRAPEPVMEPEPQLEPQPNSGRGPEPETTPAEPGGGMVAEDAPDDGPLDLMN